jgi:tRNA(Ile)-lysidine synthase
VSKRRPLILTALKQRIPARSKVLAAVSGGRDSMVLLHGLLEIKRLLGLHVEVCHVNHRLRSSSDGDADFVFEWCRARSVDCHVVSLESRPQGENLEAWARSKRYAAFRQVMADRSLGILCTAHTANDVAETLLIRLLANKELTSIEEFDPRRRCIRPLIDTTREQINEYVERCGLSCVEDPTNEDVAFVRNRVRHEVLPLLAERFEPSIVWILAERARSLAADSSALGTLAAALAESVGALRESDPEWLAKLHQTITATNIAIQWRVVQLLLTPIFGHTIGEAKARLVLDLILEGAGVVQMGEGRILHVAGTGLQIRSE